MASYRKKSPIVTAQQWKFGDSFLEGMRYDEQFNYHFIRVLKTRVKVRDTNWVIKFGRKLFGVMTDEDFQKEYELVMPNRREFKVYDMLFRREADIDAIVSKETWANNELMPSQDIQWAITEEGVLFLMDEDGNCAYYFDDDERFKVRFLT